jgi:glycosyl hydrolase family 113
LAGDRFVDNGTHRGAWKSPLRFFKGPLLGTLFLAVLAAHPQEARHAEIPFQKGMVLGIFSRSDPSYFRTSLKELQDLGVDSVSLIVPKVQKDIKATGFYDDPWITPSDESLRLAAREAHRLGMRVFLFPIVYVAQLGEKEWRGTLSPPSWDAWFRAYEEMILHYARLAAEERIEFFSIGSELCSTESFRDRWLGVIRKAREVFPGKITYSANWDHLDPVTFGGALDFLGMNAYYEVGKGETSSVEAMTARWREIQKGIRTWRLSNGDKPVVITEVGYPSRTGAGKDPWNYFGEGDPDPEEQRKCYEAFVRAWKGERMLDGVYFYLWWGDGGPGDTDYTPRGKAAASVIRSWYRGIR